MCPVKITCVVSWKHVQRENESYDDPPKKRVPCRMELIDVTLLLMILNQSEFIVSFQIINGSIVPDQIISVF